MNAKTFIIWLIVGAVAGWLAGMVVKGGGYGLIGNIIIGIVGGLIGGASQLVFTTFSIRGCAGGLYYSLDGGQRGSIQMRVIDDLTLHSLAF